MIETIAIPQHQLMTGERVYVLVSRINGSVIDATVDVDEVESWLLVTSHKSGRADLKVCVLKQQ